MSSRPEFCIRQGLIHFISRVFSSIGVVTALLVLSHGAFACLTPGSLIGGFDRESYAFLGKVKGYTSAREIKGSASEVFGLRVEVTDRLSPIDGPDEYLVFPTRRMVDCSQGGFREDELKASYPIGSEVRVIGRLAETIESSHNKDNVLEAGFQNHTMVSINPQEKKRGRSSLRTEFEYSLASESFLGSASDRFHFVAFEVQKDLVRLERTKRRTGRQAILNRLRKAPDYAQISFDLIQATYDSDRPNDIR